MGVTAAEVRQPDQIEHLVHEGTAPLSARQCERRVGADVQVREERAVLGHVPNLTALWRHPPTPVVRQRAAE